VIDRDHRGRRRVVRWVGHDPEAVNLGLIEMERATDLDQAIEVAARTGIPAQNCVIADREGRIGWTVMGPIPRRHGKPGRFPTSWASGENRWSGYLDPADYPRIKDPDGGRIWTANNRVVDGAMLALLGDGGLATGARARQIRDGLHALGPATERDMLTIQLDDRALFLERWRELLLDTLTSGRLGSDTRRAELRDVVERTWTGHASIDSAGFRLVRAFRMYVGDAAFVAILASCTEADERFHYSRLGQLEGPMWRMIVERPVWLLDPQYANWDDLLLAAADRVIERFGGDDGTTSLADATWGRLNTVELRHPLTLAVPQLARWLNVPARQLPGASHMPRVQGPRFGASERMVVSPGREADGIFHMPGGQSGHFLSPYYRAGSEAWAGGEPTPFLPGETTHLLTLVPAGSSL
jgi:penicillin amidase